MDHERRSNKFGCAILLLTVAVSVLICWQPWNWKWPSQIQFVVPQDFRGVVMVVEHADAPEGTWEGDRFVVRVPEDGIVFLRDAAPLTLYTVDGDVFVRADGTPIECGDADASTVPAEGTPCWFGGGSRSSGDPRDPAVYFWLVGEAGRRGEISRLVDDVYDVAAARYRAR